MAVAAGCLRRPRYEGPRSVGIRTLLGKILHAYFGPPSRHRCHRSASLVDQILKGANAGDLPIGEPTDFELGAKPSCLKQAYRSQHPYRPALLALLTRRPMRSTPEPRNSCPSLCLADCFSRGNLSTAG